MIRRPNSSLLLLLTVMWLPVTLNAKVLVNGPPTAFPQERVIDGPGEAPSNARDFEIDQGDFETDESGNPNQRRNIELILGFSFLLVVLTAALWRRGRKMR